MNDNTAGPRFRAEIYRDLDRRLKASRWNSGASEAHGLLSALACLGIPGDRLRTKAWLFQLSARADIELLEGLYGLILRDLQSDGFEFSLLLPDGDHGNGQSSRIESLADWCGGFIQGFLHDGEHNLKDAPDPVREAVNDIMEISRVDVDAGADEGSERQMLEIEEYLRVAVQIIFEELNPAAAPPARVVGLN